MAILVTGGAGFIGSHTVVELQNAGYDVIVSSFFFFHNIFQKYPSDFTKTPSDFTITRIFVRILFIPYTRTSAFLCLCNLAFHIFMQYISFFL